MEGMLGESDYNMLWALAWITHYPLKGQWLFRFTVENCFYSHISSEVFYTHNLQISPDSHRWKDSLVKNLSQ